MSELVLETEYLFFTVASVATLLVVILSWRVLQSKKDTQRGSEENQVQYYTRQINRQTDR